jgi:hypothetical protein
MFSRVSTESFEETAIFSWFKEDEESPLVVTAHLGLRYGPAEPWLVALTDPQIDGVLLRKPHALTEIKLASDIPGSVEELVAFVAEHRHVSASVSGLATLIEMVMDGRAVPLFASMAGGIALGHIDDGEPTAVVGPDGPQGYSGEEYPAEVKERMAVAEMIAVLLAVGGDPDRARKALAGYEPPDYEAGAVDQYRRFAGHLRRLLESGAAPPATPARWPLPGVSEAPPGIVESLTRGLPAVTARRDAIKAVQTSSEGKTREEIAQMLERELDARSVHMDRSSFEMRVDAIATELEPFGKVKVMFHAIQALRDLKKSRPGTPPDSTAEPTQERSETPGEAPQDLDNFDLPSRAAYPVSGSSNRFADVALDPVALPVLARLAAAKDLSGPRLALANVWFSPQPGSAASAAGITVNIGEQAVGQLSAADSEHFLPALAAAAERDEDAWVHARLTTRVGATPYRLQVPLPRGSN